MIGYQQPPDPPRENPQVIGMLRECERLDRYLCDAQNEWSGLRDFLRGAQFLDTEFREGIDEAYRGKLAAARATLRQIREKLLEQGYDFDAPLSSGGKKRAAP